ncbi:MAG: class I SAM-dependent methyltransferase [Chloroflexi bacterium]|nr:class I SAM-dependent methyltransferase [Chloroflexota bacterium]
MIELARTASSLRDPWGFMVEDDRGTLLRQINPPLANSSRKFFDSKLYSSMVAQHQLVEHKYRSSEFADETTSAVFEPRRLPVVTYPYEWPFSLLKKAALLTLDIQISAVDAGFTLRDGTAFNVLFEGLQPIFIDFGSFDVRTDDKPWVGYKQFCEHFLAPLSLAARYRLPVQQFNSGNMDGFPLGVASSIMPMRSWLNWGLLWHLHLHAKSIRRNSKRKRLDSETKSVSMRGLKGVLTSLRNTVRSLDYPIEKSDWATYYRDNSYSDRTMSHKEELIDQWLASGPKSDLIVDLGGNAGRFSEIASRYANNVVLVDSDHDSVELAAREFDKRGLANIYTVVLDLTDSSNGRGWEGHERSTFYSRIKPQKSLALALIHHLVIGAGIPMERVASHFREITPSLLIEFVPPGDPMVDLLIANKSGQHHEYSVTKFEQAFAEHYSLNKKQDLADSGRVLYEFVANTTDINMSRADTRR